MLTLASIFEMRLRCLSDVALPHLLTSLIISGAAPEDAGRISRAGLAHSLLHFSLISYFSVHILGSFQGVSSDEHQNRNSSVIARLLGQIPLAESDYVIQRNLASRHVAMVTSAMAPLWFRGTNGATGAALRPF